MKIVSLFHMSLLLRCKASVFFCSISEHPDSLYLEPYTDDSNLSRCPFLILCILKGEERELKSFLLLQTTVMNDIIYVWYSFKFCWIEGLLAMKKFVILLLFNYGDSAPFILKGLSKMSIFQFLLNLQLLWQKL